MSPIWVGIIIMAISAVALTIGIINWRRLKRRK
jgi:hypothetical protein